MDDPPPSSSGPDLRPLGSVFRPVILVSLALGIAGDLLLRGRDGPGLNFFLLALGLAAGVWNLSRRAGVELSREALGTVGVGLALTSALLLRASEPLRVFTILAAVVALALPALKAGAAWLRGSGVSDQLEAVGWTALSGLTGPLRLLGSLRGGTATSGPTGGGIDRGQASRHPAWAAARGLLIAIPFLIGFGALFMSADRVFADLVNRLVRFDFDLILTHLLLTGFLTWLASGYLSGFLTGTRFFDLRSALGGRPRLGIGEVGTALALVDVLFLAFVAVQLRYLFGGSSLVEVTPGLSYAEYVREGFGQLAVACALVLPSLLAADWLLESSGRRATLAFRVLGGLLLVLLLVIVASALQRVRAYQAAYGLTESRLYGALFVGWLTLLTVWFAVTVLRGRRERFAFGALASGAVFLAFLHLVNPDALIARTNLGRQTPVLPAPNGGTEGLDARYLASLSADAVPVVLEALSGLPPAQQCHLARGMLRRWGPDGSEGTDWRSWNWSIARARGLVQSEASTLAATSAGADGAACQPGRR